MQKFSGIIWIYLFWTWLCVVLNKNGFGLQQSKESNFLSVKMIAVHTETELVIQELFETVYILISDQSGGFSYADFALLILKYPAYEIDTPVVFS